MPPPSAASPVNDVNVTSPVSCARIEYFATADWPGAIESNDTVGSESSCAPVIDRGSRLTLTRFAAVRDVLVTVA